MCGRYTFTQMPKADQVVRLEEQSELSLQPRYNIAPAQACLVKPINDPQRYHFYRWGLIPAWAKDPKIGYKMINARSETVLEKPAFRQAVRQRRCLVPADGFYEWKKSESGKQPYRITLQKGQPFYFAGLSEHWRSSEGEEIHSFTILTIEPNELMAELHNRMPVILRPDEASAWIDPQREAEALVHHLRPYEADQMRAYPVSQAVGNVRHDYPQLIEPQSEQGSLF